jgi:hypothetical protein
MKIIKNGSFTWTNEHGTFTQPIKDLYDLANETTGRALDIYNDTTKGIQEIIREAIQTKTPLRALGGSWSFSPVAATNGIILNTKPLNIRFPVSPGSVSPKYPRDPKYLCMAQCGNRVWELSKHLHNHGLSLSATGASNGQTIAGAIATGTHGAALDFGAIQESVVALHLITGPDTQLWLERSSYPVMADTFPDKLGATLLRDDEVFNAALVNIGAMGFVHGALIEAEDDFLLESYQRRAPYDDAMIQQMGALDFSNPHLPYPGVRPFHMQVLINPYDMKNGVFMTTMYKRPYRDGYTAPGPNAAGIGPGDDAPCFIGKLAGVVPGLVPLMVNKVLTASLNLHEKQFGRLSEIFNNTKLRGKLASAAIGLPLSSVKRVIEVLMEMNESAGPFVGLFAFRFVKSSPATMAFTRFAPVTCVLELDGILSPETLGFYDAVWNKLEQENIPYTFHWGKMSTIAPDRLRRMYGNSLDKFLIVRSRIIEPAVANIFSNDIMKQWGIDQLS